MESPFQWDALTAVLAQVAPHDAAEALALVRCFALLRASGAGPLAAVMDDERGRDHTGPTFAARVAASRALRIHRTQRSWDPDPRGLVARSEVVRFRAGLQSRFCGSCGVPSTELWQLGRCLHCGAERVDLPAEATLRQCGVCLGFEPGGAPWCERCGEGVDAPRDHGPPDWRREVASGQGVHSWADLAHATSCLRAAADERNPAVMEALEPLLAGVLGVLRQPTANGLTSGGRWRLQRVLCDLGGLSFADSVDAALAALAGWSSKSPEAPGRPASSGA
jgi:hypothetical protein